MRIEAIDVFENAVGYERARIPGIVCCNTGTLIAYCELRRSDSDWAVIDIGMKKSTDGGKSWSDRCILVSGEGINTVNNPVMITADGMLYFFYCVNYRRVFFMKSTDEGESWSEAKELTAEIRNSLDDFSFTCIATGPTHGISLTDGTFLVPVWMAYNEKDEKSHHPSVIAMLYSRDGGESFFAGKISDELHDPSEFTVAQLADGRIIANIRHEGEKKCRAEALVAPDFSLRDIRLCEELPDPVCCAGMCKSDDGVLFTNCADQKSRIILTLRKISSRGDIKESLVISDIAGYSDVAVSPDGKTAYVIYEKEKMLYRCTLKL